MNEQGNRQLAVDIKFKVRDILRYNMWVALKSTVNKIMICLGIIIGGVYVYKLFNRTVALDIFIANNILLLLVPGMIFLLIPWRVWKITLSQMQMPAFAFGVKYTFTSDKIILDLGNTKDEMSWDLFIEIIETKKDLRFFVDPVRAQLIPKHNLTKEQLDLLKHIAVHACKSGICKFDKK